MLPGIFVKSCCDLSKPENSESGDSWLGLGPPLVIGVGFLLLGVVLMLLWGAGTREFFRRRPEVATEPARADGYPRWPARSSSASTAPRARRPRWARRSRLAKELGAALVIAFAYHSSPLGGEVKDLRDALVERGERVTQEALAEAQAAGVDARAELVRRPSRARARRPGRAARRADDRRRLLRREPAAGARSSAPRRTG